MYGQNRGALEDEQNFLAGCASIKRTSDVAAGSFRIEICTRRI
jgi:hypothetical protein